MPPNILRVTPRIELRAMTRAGEMKAPIIHALRGKEFIEYDNPYDVGMSGLVSFASGSDAMKDCDTLLVLARISLTRQFFPEGARIAQIVARPEALGNRCPLEVGLLGDVKETLAALLPRINMKEEAGHLEDALAHYVRARKDLDSLADVGPNSRTVRPQYVTRVVSELTAGDTIFTCDVGTGLRSSRS